MRCRYAVKHNHSFSLSIFAYEPSPIGLALDCNFLARLINYATSAEPSPRAGLSIPIHCRTKRRLSQASDPVPSLTSNRRLQNECYELRPRRLLDLHRIQLFYSSLLEPSF